MKNKGFTLIEILAVVAIMAIIALVAIPNIFKSIDEGNVRKYKAVEERLKNSLQMYNEDVKEDIWKLEDDPGFNLYYRPTLEELKKRDSNLDVLDCDVKFLEITREPYNGLYQYRYKVCIKCGDVYKTEEAYCSY